MQVSLKEAQRATRKFWRLHFWFLQNLTVILLFVGYTGYYACRSWFAVIKPLLLLEQESLLIDLEVIGLLTSIGTVGYALGKLIGSVITDFLGGKLVFVLAMLISIFCTLIFGLSNTILAFSIAWGANRLVQALGWGALVKIVAQWFSYRNYGKVMAVLSLSFLLGDSLWRWIMGKMLEQGWGWRGILFWAAAALAIIAMLNWFFLSSRPPKLMAQRVETSPFSLFGGANYEAPLNIFQLLKPYFLSLKFWFVAIMSLGLTFSRETVNEWLSTYITQSANVSAGVAAQYSAIFQLAGSASVLILGFMSDHFFRGNRAFFIALFQLLLAILLGYLYWGDFKLQLSYLPFIITTIAFLLIGPYSFIAGAMALDLGGKTASAAASFLADGIGYIASILAGYGIAQIVKFYNWNQVFLLLSITSFITSTFAIVFAIMAQKVSLKNIKI
ncbi:MAG: MFS transporter [Bacteroidia bacterium]|nr:MFS transporter [Bacteroidia bacterium]